MSYKKGLVLALFLLFAGCGEKIYEKNYHKPSQPISCIRLQAKNPITFFTFSKIYHFTSDKNCPFTLHANSHYVASCAAAKAKALGSDFDGYLRLSLYEKDRLLYRNQMDFKGALRQEIAKKLFDRMRKAIGF